MENHIELGGPEQSYNHQHAEFVASETGTSPIEILHVLFSVSMTPLLASLLTPWIVPSKFIPMAFGDRESRNFIRALIEYPIIMLLPLLIITVFAGHSSETEDGFYQQLSYCLPTALLLSCAGIVIVNHSITKPKWSSLVSQCHRLQDKIITNCLSGKKLMKKSIVIPFFTTYRASVIYLTVLSILAVDFKIFPRRFAKTKVYGFSLMDVGTGSFIFANGIVSSEAKRMTSNFRQTILSSVPLFILGFLRLFFIKGLEYHEVVEEYGVHWNFFFTLAVVKILSAILLRIVHAKHTLKIGFIIGLIYDSILVFAGLQNEYLLNSSRSHDESFIDANREGIFSSIGYTCIYMMSIYCGQLIYQHKVPLVRIRDWMQYALVSGTQIIVLWTLTYLAHNYWNPSSRRVGNFTYVLWSVSTNYTVLWFNLFFYLIQHLLQNTGLIYGPLLFYQLEAQQKDVQLRKIKEDIERSRMEDETKWRLEKDERLNASTDIQLTRLEGKLELIQEKIKEQREGAKDDSKGFSNKELEALATEMEEELKMVRNKCVDGPSLLDVVKKAGRDKEANFAYLPDLTLTPATLSAVAYNGLAVFLLGNLLTGGVNSMIISMYTPNAIALLILWAYATVITCFSIILYFYKIQLKFW